MVSLDEAGDAQPAGRHQEHHKATVGVQRDEAVGRHRRTRRRWVRGVRQDPISNESLAHGKCCEMSTDYTAQARTEHVTRDKSPYKPGQSGAPPRVRRM